MAAKTTVAEESKTRVLLKPSLNIKKLHKIKKGLLLKSCLKTNSALKVDLELKTPPMKGGVFKTRLVQREHKQGAAFRAGSNHFFTQSA
jgi:hypothetical protein